MIDKVKVPEIPFHAFMSDANAALAVFIAETVLGVTVVLLLVNDAHLAALFVASLQANRKKTPRMPSVTIHTIGTAMKMVRNHRKLGISAIVFPL